MSVFVHAQGIKIVHAGGGGQIMAKFCPRSCWLLNGRLTWEIARPDFACKCFLVKIALCPKFRNFVQKALGLFIILNSWDMFLYTNKRLLKMVKTKRYFFQYLIRRSFSKILGLQFFCWNFESGLHLLFW